MSLYNLNNDDNFNGITEDFKNSGFYDPNRTNPFAPISPSLYVNKYKNKMNNKFYSIYLTFYHHYYLFYLKNRSNIKYITFLEYFKFLHIEHTPNLYEYEILIKKFGIPDFLNPYDDGTIEYEYYGQSHVLGREIENILYYMMFKNVYKDEEEQINNMPYQEYCSKVLNREIKNTSGELEIKKNNYLNSIHLLALTFQYANSEDELKNLFEMVDISNIKNISQEIFFNVDQTYYHINEEKLEENFVKLKIFNKKEMEFLKKLKFSNIKHQNQN